MTIAGFLWGNRTAKTITVICGAFASIFGLITAAHTAWPIVDPYVLAHRGYVLEKIGGVQATTNDLLIWKFEDNRDRAKADVEDKRILLQKEDNPQIRALIQQNIDSSSQKQKEYDDRIRKLRGN